MRRTLFGVALLFLLPAALLADYLQVQRSVTLKTEPVGNSDILDTLPVGSRLELLQDSQENGYYRVRFPQSGQDGWVYRTFVRRFPGTIPSSQPTGAPPSRPPTAAAGSGTWFRFDRDFVQHRFSGELAFSSLTFDTQWKSSSIHDASCGGKDGEIHIGAYENSIEFQSGETPFSRVADGQTVAWGLVAEPPNATSDDLNALRHLEDSRVTFTGYLRVWNEGHFDDERLKKPNGSTNPNHIMELHPTWQLQSADDEFEEYSFRRTGPMTGYAGYGLSKARSMLQTIQTGAWPKAYATSGSVYVLLSQESNFYQLPVRIRDVRTVGEGLVVRADVCEAVGCSGNQFAYRDLRLIARAASFNTPLNVGDAIELVGIFSVNLGQALNAAQAATTRAQAVSVSQSLEFFVFSKATKTAVRTAAASPSHES